MTVEVTAQQLYAEMDRATPGWRSAQHPNFDAAVQAAGTAAAALCATWKTAFARKTDTRLVARDARKAEKARIAQERYQHEVPSNHPATPPQADTPAFENSSAGRHLAAEWVSHFQSEHQPGWTNGRWKGNQAEVAEDDADDSQRRGPTTGRVEDPLYHPDRPANAAPWSFPSYVWSPVAPRSYAGSPRCY